MPCAEKSDACPLRRADTCHTCICAVEEDDLDQPLVPSTHRHCTLLASASPIRIRPHAREGCDHPTAMSLYVRDPVIGRLIRIIMRDGKKHCAMRIVDDSFSVLRTQHGIANPFEFTKRAIENAKPLVETRKYRASGRAIHVPVPCKPARQESLALRFLRYVLVRPFAFAPPLSPCIFFCMHFVRGANVMRCIFRLQGRVPVKEGKGLRTEARKGAC